MVEKIPRETRKREKREKQGEPEEGDVVVFVADEAGLTWLDHCFPMGNKPIIIQYNNQFVFI